MAIGRILRCTYKDTCMVWHVHTRVHTWSGMYIQGYMHGLTCMHTRIHAWAGMYIQGYMHGQALRSCVSALIVVAVLPRY